MLEIVSVGRALFVSTFNYRGLRCEHNAKHRQLEKPRETHSFMMIILVFTGILFFSSYLALGYQSQCAGEYCNCYRNEDNTIRLYCVDKKITDVSVVLSKISRSVKNRIVYINLDQNSIYTLSPQMLSMLGEMRLLEYVSLKQNEYDICSELEITRKDITATLPMVCTKGYGGA